MIWNDLSYNGSILKKSTNFVYFFIDVESTSLWERIFWLIKIKRIIHYLDDSPGSHKSIFLDLNKQLELFHKCFIQINHHLIIDKIHH